MSYEKEIDEDVKNSVINELMTKAIESNSAEAVRFFLENGVAFYEIDQDGVSFFIRCIEKENIDMVKAFVNTGKIQVNRYYNDLYIRATPLTVAAHCDNIEIAELLICSGAEVNIKEIDGYLLTPLIAALASDKREMYDFLLENGADIDFSFYELIKGSELISESKTSEIAETLLKHGADPNSEDEFGTPVLSVAITSYQFGIVNLLIKYGADINAKDEDGKTAREEIIDSIKKYETYQDDPDYENILKLIENNFQQD